MIEDHIIFAQFGHNTRELETQKGERGKYNFVGYILFLSIVFFLPQPTLSLTITLTLATTITLSPTLKP